ncbi:MAG TPA: hypothetical protein VII11_05020 [Bacteroidota bacterium]
MNQMTLTIGSLTCIGILTFSVNTLLLNRQKLNYETEATITGVSIGQAIIEEITVKSFDDNFTGTKYTDDSTLFVPPAMLGVDSAETAGDNETFNDVDDYNAHIRSVVTPRYGNYSARCEVSYVTASSPMEPAATQTFLKRIDVYVKNPFIPSPDSTLKVSKLISYRYK